MVKKNKPVKRESVGSAAGISGSKQTVEALKSSLSLLSASLESTADGILIVDRQGKIALWNQKFADMWKIPEEVLSSRDDEKAINHILKQLADPEQFVARVRKLYEQPEQSSFDQIEFLDGRVFERYSQPQRIEGDIMGRVWSFRDVTKRNRADEALARSEERYRTTLENMQDSYVEVDLAGNFTFINEAASHNLGYTREELIGSNFSNIAFGDDELKAVFKAYNEVYKTGEPHKGFAFKIMRKDGTTGYGETSISLLKDAQGRSIGFRSVGRDVTERKQTEEALKKSEWKFKSIVEHITDIFFMLNSNREMIYISPQAKQVLGYTLEEIRNNWRNYMTNNPVNLAGYEKTTLAFTTGEKQEPYLQEFVHRDGTKRLVEINESPIKNAEGEVIGIVGAARDVTLRKEAEEAILRSKLLLQSVIDSTPDWMYVKDFQHKFLLVNKSFAKAQNISPQDMIGKADTDFFPEELCMGNPDRGIAGFHADDLQAFQGHMVHSPRNLVTWADGSMHIYDTYKIPLTDQSGKIYGALAYSRDFTERQKAEDEREAALQSVRKTLDSMISAMSRIVEMRDPYTAGHQKHVAELAGAIARGMNLTDSQIEHLVMAARIHDIGKMYVPSDILSKPGKLSDIEWSLIKTHVQGSFDILQDIEFSQPVALMVLQHHERLDGSGYPNGLKGEETLFEAKILAVADVIEAMVSHRPYRPALGIDKALEEISQNRGRLYDPDVADACVKLFNSGRFEFKTV